jgi:hypothetical protein
MTGVCAGGCPYGLVNDPYPGQCSRYIDGDGNGICDLSQTYSSTTTSQDSSDSSTDSTTDTTSSSAGHGNGSLNDSVGDNNTTVPFDSDSGLSGSSLDDGSNFHILPVSLILLGSYFFTYFLFKKGILKPKQHKRLWNLLVTFGYVGTGITGVILTILINLGISTAYNAGISYWHAELAILMVIGTIIHIHIYQKPFKKMFKSLFGFKSPNKGNSNNKNKKVFEARGSSK